jgi:hypothetical protein
MQSISLNQHTRAMDAGAESERGMRTLIKRLESLKHPKCNSKYCEAYFNGVKDAAAKTRTFADGLSNRERVGEIKELLQDHTFIGSDEDKARIIIAMLRQWIVG